MNPQHFPSHSFEPISHNGGPAPFAGPHSNPKVTPICTPSAHTN